MNPLPTLSVTARLNALAAAAVVTLILLSGIDRLATAQGNLPQLAQSDVARPA